jgi:peroxiredoxin
MTSGRRSALCFVVVLFTVLLAAAVGAGAAEEEAGKLTARVGGHAPDFVLQSVDGRDVVFSSLQGKVVVLSFWDCYADVCFTSVSVLEEMFRRYPKEKFALVTLCYEVPAAMAKDNYKKLMENCGMGQVILVDDRKYVKQLYGVTTAPTTFLIGADMVIWEKLTTVPELRSEDFRTKVDSFVKSLP